MLGSARALRLFSRTLARPRTRPQLRSCVRLLRAPSCTRFKSSWSSVSISFTGGFAGFPLSIIINPADSSGESATSSVESSSAGRIAPSPSESLSAAFFFLSPVPSFRPVCFPPRRSPQTLSLLPPLLPPLPPPLLFDGMLRVV